MHQPRGKLDSGSWNGNRGDSRRSSSATTCLRKRLKPWKPSSFFQPRGLEAGPHFVRLTLPSRGKEKKRKKRERNVRVITRRRKNSPRYLTLDLLVRFARGETWIYIYIYIFFSFISKITTLKWSLSARWVGMKRNELGGANSVTNSSTIGFRFGTSLSLLFELVWNGGTICFFVVSLDQVATEQRDMQKLQAR